MGNFSEFSFLEQLANRLDEDRGVRVGGEERGFALELGQEGDAAAVGLAVIGVELVVGELVDVGRGRGSPRRNWRYWAVAPGVKSSLSSSFFQTLPSASRALAVGESSVSFIPATFQVGRLAPSMTMALPFVSGFQLKPPSSSSVEKISPCLAPRKNDLICFQPLNHTSLSMLWLTALEERDGTADVIGVDV